MSVGYSFKFFFRPFLVKLVKSETESKSILGIKLFGSPLRNQTLDTQPTTTKTFIPSQCGKDFLENFQNGLSLTWFGNLPKQSERSLQCADEAKSIDLSRTNK